MLELLRGTAAATLVPAEVGGDEWGEGSSRSPGTLGGRLSTRKPLASHLSVWWPVGPWEQGPGGGEGRGGFAAILS